MCQYAKANIRLTVITARIWLSFQTFAFSLVRYGVVEVRLVHNILGHIPVIHYTNWGYGEPSIFAPCMNILFDGKWSDAECHSTFEFICEKPV